MAGAAACSPYGLWVAQGTEAVEVEPQPPPQGRVRLRLFCVPPAGMGGQCYHGWTKGLPRSVELMPLELPGRGTRMCEQLPYAESLRDLARKILDGVGLEVFKARPFVLFGHSFGAWVVYEMFQELVARSGAGWPLPEKLYVSAARPPQLSAIEHDPDRASPALAGLDEAQFWEAFERRYGCNPDLQSPYIRGFVMNLLRADFGLLESYRPACLEPLPRPLCALCAKGDRRCRPAQLSAWSACAAEGAFQERWFEDGLRPGSWANEHRYVAESSASLLRFLHADLPLVGGPASGYAGIDGPLPGAQEEEEAAAKQQLEAAGEGPDASRGRGAPCALL